MTVPDFHSLLSHKNRFLVRNLQFIMFTTCGAFGSFGFSGAKCVRMVHIVSFVSCGSPNQAFPSFLSFPFPAWFCKCHLFKNLFKSKQRLSFVFV